MSMSVDLFLYPCLSLVSVLDDLVGPERSVEHVKMSEKYLNLFWRHWSLSVMKRNLSKK